MFVIVPSLIQLTTQNPLQCVYTQNHTDGGDSPQYIDSVRCQPFFITDFLIHLYIYIYIQFFLLPLVVSIICQHPEAIY